MSGDFDPTSFDKPVKDYTFTEAASVNALFEQMRDAGGFTATKFVEAKDINAVI